MKVICIKDTAKDLDLAVVNDIFTNAHNYGLTIGREYLVMGIVIYKRSTCPYYLIDQKGKPRWYPCVLFDVVDNRLAPDWSIELLDKNGPSDLSVLLGFSDLCNDDDFYDALMDREEQAMLIYFERKEECENYLYRKRG